jgi:predicted DNA-binding transcriptional regulator YafY
MDYLLYNERLDYLKEIIAKGLLKSPKDLTKRFDCCERTVRRMIEKLRLMGINVKYNKYEKKYYIE